jgi:hypothetical protein
MPANPVAAGPPRMEEAPGKPTVRSVWKQDSGAESGVGKLIVWALALGLVVTFIGVGFVRLRTTGGTVEYKGVLQQDLGLTAQSDYFDIVRKLGPPDEDRWKENSGERQYRALVYKKADLVMILMGADRDKVQYIGAKDGQWRTVHAVTLPGNTNTEAILRTLPKF